MRHAAAEVVSVADDGTIKARMLEGPFAGLVLSDDVRPSFPAGCWLPPVAGDRVLIVLGEQDPPGRPYYIAETTTTATTAEIAIDGDRNVLLRQGTKGVARKGDDVDGDLATMTAFAAINTQLQALGQAGFIVPTNPIGTISSASGTVKAGD